MHSFLGLIAQRNPPFPAQGHTPLWHCFRLRLNRGSKAAKRLGRQKEDSGQVQAQGQGPITPFLHSPPSTSLRDLTHHWLTGHALGARQCEVKWAGAPAREVSFISSVAQGPKVSHSALAMGGVTASENSRAVPNTDVLTLGVFLLWRHLPSQGQPNPEGSKPQASKWAFQLQTNQSGTHTPISSFIRLLYLLRTLVQN